MTAPASRLRSLFGVVAALVFGTVVALAVLEGGLRGVAWMTLQWRGGKDAPDAAALRILYLGESTTFGLGVQPAEAYPIVTTELLAARHPERRFQAFNRGLPGMVTNAMLITLPEKLDTLTPQVVVILAGANDFNEELNHIASVENWWIPRPLVPYVRELRLYKTVRLALELARPDVGRTDVLQHGEVVYYRHGTATNILHDPPRDDAKIARVTAQLEANLTTMIERSRKAGAKVAVMGYMQSPSESDIAERVAMRTNALWVPTLIPREQQTPDLFTPDGWHPSAKGHRRIAETLAAALEPLLN